MCRAEPRESAKTVARKPSGKVTVSGAADPPVVEVAAAPVSAEPGVRAESPQARMAKESKGKARAKV